MRRLVLLPLLLLLAACGEPEADLGPPDGWLAEDDRWWREGTDTALAFRDLSGFETFGLSPREDGMRAEGPIERNVQRRFLPLYRNHPEIVDSVFTAVALPIIQREASPGDSEQERDRLGQTINRAMHRVFYPPRRDQENSPQIVVPDSLRGVATGTVELQVFVGADRRAHAIELLESVHPSMDALVMRRYAESAWLPARLNGEAVDAWFRASLSF